MYGIGNYTSDAEDGFGATVPVTAVVPSSKPAPVGRTAAAAAAVDLPTYLYSIVANDIAVNGMRSPFVGVYIAARASTGDSGSLNALKNAIQRAWPMLENAFLRSRGVSATHPISAY